MGNSRFRLSHVMPNVWFYKLRDMGRLRESHRRFHRSTSSRDESAINLSRSSYHFSRTQRVNVFQAASGEQAMQKAQMVDNEPVKRKAQSKGKKSKSGFSVESRISASCSCRATVESVWKNGERNEEFCSSDEQEALEDFLPKKSECMKKSCCTQFMERFEQNQFALELESKSGNWKLPRHRFNVDINSPDLYSIWATDIEEKNRFLQYLEECKPSITRPRHGQISEYGIQEQKGDAQKKFVPDCKMSASGKMQFSNDVGTRAFKKQGKSRGNLGKNNSRACSPKPNVMDWRSNSFAVVKSSSDPQRDFIESMVEMIIEKDIHCYGDLQRLLECYLSLNPAENHEMIVKAFERVRSEFMQLSSFH